MKTGRTPPELLLLLLAAGAATAAANFTCSAPATCIAMAGYVPADDTTLAAVASLFTLPSKLSLVAANNLPASTLPSHPFPANSTVRVPFPCNCSGAGIGVSGGGPIYIVRPGDGLDYIARVHFNGIVTYQEIAAANGIRDPNLITVGQELRIPLPCSCDDVGGVPTVHYAHMVAPRSSVEGIATEFGTTAETLLRLNPSLGGDPNNLLANSFLDVPLRACASNIRNDSLDSGLLVTNGSYSLTANGCVQCSCDSANWELQCRPSQGLPISRWNRCPSMQCGASRDVIIGNVTASSDCQRTVCSYTGYTNTSILAQLIRESTCPSPPPSIQPPRASTPNVEPPRTSPPANSTTPSIQPPGASTPNVEPPRTSPPANSTPPSIQPPGASTPNVEPPRTSPPANSTPPSIQPPGASTPNVESPRTSPPANSTPPPSIQPPGASTPNVEPPRTSPPANSTPPLGLQWWNWALAHLVLTHISLSW